MNDDIVRLVLQAQLGSTLFMTGLIWFVQLVHYPLFARTGTAEFSAYEQQHTRRTTWIVAPLMLIEGISALLLIWYHPPEVAHWQVWTGLILIVFLGFSTALIQVPCHEILSRGFDARVHRRLVTTNWARTLAWTLRTLLVLSMC